MPCDGDNVTAEEFSVLVEYAHFASKAKKIRELVEPFLSEYFGDHCSDCCIECECCRRWRLLENLLENPFDKTI